jgi:hypothetical protein
VLYRNARLIRASLPEEEYSYLLCFYLGDGHISLHRQGVYRLRIKTDAQYPGSSRSAPPRLPQ